MVVSTVCSVILPPLRNGSAWCCLTCLSLIFQNPVKVRCSGKMNIEERKMCADQLQLSILESRIKIEVARRVFLEDANVEDFVRMMRAVPVPVPDRARVSTEINNLHELKTTLLFIEEDVVSPLNPNLVVDIGQLITTVNRRTKEVHAQLQTQCELEVELAECLDAEVDETFESCHMCLQKAKELKEKVASILADMNLDSAKEELCCQLEEEYRAQDELKEKLAQIKSNEVEYLSIARQLKLVKKKISVLKAIERMADDDYTRTQVQDQFFG